MGHCNDCNNYNTCNSCNYNAYKKDACCGFSGFGDNCGWIVLLVGAYFFLCNGCVGNIFGNCDNSIIWIIILFFFLFLFNQNNGNNFFC